MVTHHLVANDASGALAHMPQPGPSPVEMPSTPVEQPEPATLPDPPSPPVENPVDPTVPDDLPPTVPEVPEET